MCKNLSIKEVMGKVNNQIEQYKTSIDYLKVELGELAKLRDIEEITGKLSKSKQLKLEKIKLDLKNDFFINV